MSMWLALLDIARDAAPLTLTPLQDPNNRRDLGMVSVPAVPRHGQSVSRKARHTDQADPKTSFPRKVFD